MAAPATPETDPDLQKASWDLDPLVGGEGREGVERRMAEALQRSQAFAERYAGKLGELDHAGLAAAMGELADITELAARAGYFAALRFSTDTADPADRRPDAVGAGAGDGDPDDAAVLRARVGRAGETSEPRSCSPAMGSTSPLTTCATYAATATTCSPSPRSGSSPRSR